MAKSKIEWTDETENVIVVAGEDGQPDGWYCEKVSEGCEHCYAERLNGTPFYGGNGLAYAKRREGPPPLMIRRDILEGWKRKRAPKRRFVNSMTDTFGEFVIEWWVDEILQAAREAENQTFQFLTKRPGRMLGLVLRFLRRRGLDRLPENIWLGVSVENQQRADERRTAMDGLAQYAVTWVSYEPALGMVDWTGWEFLRWMVVGGESGPHARPMHPDWARAVRDWCGGNEKPFFMKQMGGWPDKGGELLSLPFDLRIREFPHGL